MTYQNILKWHRYLSLIIALPVALWALSGFMHPIMTNLRPVVGKQWLPPQAIEGSQIKIDLSEALRQNRISSFNRFRIVLIGGHSFYQVLLPNHQIPVYISTENGKILKNGDELYARQLAKMFLFGEYPTKGPQQTNPSDHSNRSSIGPSSLPYPTEYDTPDPVHEAIMASLDCCMAATNAAMENSGPASITSIEFIDDFSAEYKEINRYLPVYKVQFDRADGIRIYVETHQGRFALAVDNKRAVFDWIFSLFHTHTWLDFTGKGKLLFEISLCLTAALTTVLGIYVFFTSPQSKGKSQLAKTRRYHRYTSVVASLFTLMFTLSGAFHAFEKIKPTQPDQSAITYTFTPKEASFKYDSIQKAVGYERPIANIQLVKIYDIPYFQVFYTSNRRSFQNQKPIAETGADLMKAKSVPQPTILYFRASDLSALKDGERVYARFLASKLGKCPEKHVIKTELITQFKGEYGFVNKRLPVWKVSFPQNYRERFYVETSTGVLAAYINDLDLIEGYSFSMLHKHHFMDIAGKKVRDLSTMFWAMAQVVLIFVGLSLWWKLSKQSLKR